MGLEKKRSAREIILKIALEHCKQRLMRRRFSFCLEEPDEFFDRLKEKNLIDAIQQFNGTIIGFSAGAMVQIQDFHIIEDDLYKEYSYHEGLDLLTDFDVEVHFEKDDSTMQASIQRCLKEKKKVVYGIGNAGAVIVEGDSILTLGEVEKYEKKPQ